ncbi:ATPase [Mycobacterium vulneris]|jgi:serine phosphatase RsbU (regulator of sigma subunit)/anti-sigma regulatory factor (Ser/Thr protein kinase)/transcriptional regulator with GAF, ATPase, and Fis domain|uniref:ATPase n=1 Tax=Mycolicibacterium vulneris TaxID=547163 RepID=A0A1X2KNE2_9MYCO|nr:SpoIIE family protein phosphatase [Mycolicibacterium vulneris]OSC23205.1 ATPase [Mycolicibacterium vulneris]
MDSDRSDSAFTWQGRRDLVSRMHDQLDELVAARDQMEQLVRVIVEIGSDLDLDVTLHRVLKAAMELTGARYAALGIRAADGTLVSFVYAGIDADIARRLGDLPVGDGLRVDDLNSHPATRGLSGQEPPMHALLGIPITVRAANFGSLYLADDRPGRAFSDTQEGAVRAMATAAAAAIDNARLFERERESAKWTKASREITTALLSGDPQTGPLQLIVNRALELAGAEQAILLVPKEAELPVDQVDTLVVAATAGRYASEVIGRQVPMDGSTTGGVARRGLPLITDSFQYPIEGFTDVGERSAIVMPLIADDAVLGVIAVARDPHQPAFGNDYLDLVSDFARHAAIALALAAGREHALNQELAQADTVDEAVNAAAEELRRLWRARRVLAVTFPTQTSSTLETTFGAPRVVSVGEPAQWADLPSATQQALRSLRDGDLLAPNGTQPGTAGIALQHPDGVLVVWMDLTAQRPFTLEDQTLLTVLAGRLGQGLQRVHQVDQQRETALALQHAILGPADLPSGFAVRYQAATRPLQVGGDWYDIVDLDDGRIALIVGDCVGHGLAAATVMGQVRSACRALLFENPSPGAALAGMDRFAARLPGAQCTTAVCAVLTPETGELVYSSAGHPPPILVHGDGSTQILDDGHTIALGIRGNWIRPEARVTIPARSTLLLYTDGLVERRRVPLDHGISRVAGVAQDSRALKLEDLANQVMSRVAPDGGYQDDVVLLLYRHPAPLELNFPAEVSQLAPTRTALRNWLTRARLDPDQTLNVLVAAGEAVSNAIEHGHRQRPEGTIRLGAVAVGDEVQLTITDTGSWKAPQPASRPHRGRGIPLMRSLMQDVDIRPDTNGTTVYLSTRIT